MVSKQSQGVEARGQGLDFEQDMHTALAKQEGVYQIPLSGSGRFKPGDVVISVGEFLLLLEYKTTSKKKFSIHAIRSNQLRGALEFESANKRHLAFLVISFLTSGKVYALRVRNYISVLKKLGIGSISAEDVVNVSIPIETNGSLLDVTEFISSIKSMTYEEVVSKTGELL